MLKNVLNALPEEREKCLKTPDFGELHNMRLLLGIIHCASSEAVILITALKLGFDSSDTFLACRSGFNNIIRDRGYLLFSVLFTTPFILFFVRVFTYAIIHILRQSAQVVMVHHLV